MIFSICSSVNSSDFKNSRFIYMTSIGYVFLRGYDHEPLCSLTSTNGKKTKNNIRKKQFYVVLRTAIGISPIPCKSSLTTCLGQSVMIPTLIHDFLFFRL